MAAHGDAAMISVLVAAQAPALAGTRDAGPCALRGMHRAEVIRSDAPGARLAGGVSLLLAGGMLRDHAADGDLPGLARPVAAMAGRRWEARGGAGLTAVGLDPAALAGVADRQERLERIGPGEEAAAEGGVRRDSCRAGEGDGRALLALTAPTEAATAAAIAHTATVAGRPSNVMPLAETGRLIGRVAHLTDALADQADDDRRGQWNPLTATGTPPAVALDAVGAALVRVRSLLQRLDLPGHRPGAATAAAVQAELAWRLLAEVLPRSVRRALGRAGHQPGLGPKHQACICRVRGGQAAGDPWGAPEPAAPHEPEEPGALPASPQEPPGEPGAYPPVYFPGAAPRPAEPLAGGNPEPVRGRSCGWTDCCSLCGEGDCCDCCDCGGCDC
jgi:hypothetical protein